MASLTGEHADLAAMMSVVGDEIAEETGYVRSESFYPAVVFQG